MSLFERTSMKVNLSSTSCVIDAALPFHTAIVFVVDMSFVTLQLALLSLLIFIELLNMEICLFPKMMMGRAFPDAMLCTVFLCVFAVQGCQNTWRRAIMLRCAPMTAPCATCSNLGIYPVMLQPAVLPLIFGH